MFYLLVVLACRNKDPVTDSGIVTDDSSCAPGTWYADGDGDGYGDANNPVEACEQPPDTSDVTGDCNDDEPLAYDGAVDVCDDVDNDCDGITDEDPDTEWYPDKDHDGYGTTDGERAVSCDQPAGYSDQIGDCDDSEADVYPDAPEYCDELDNDCDGDIDEDDTFTFYEDADGDGFGVPDSTVTDCAPPSGYSDVDTDCDDADPAINPDAEEVCNELDDDCDDDIDEDVTTTFYADSDADGYGDADTTVEACSAPSGYSDLDTDCDDAEATTNPGATEYCDTADNDCDGDIDEDDASDATTWYTDGDSDGYGDAVDSTSCDQPSGTADVDGDCDDTDSGVNPGESEVCENETDDDCDGDIDENCTVEHCGTISADETWDATLLHEVTCDVYVQGSSRPVLTIEDGAEVYFDSGADLYVATGSYGSIEVEGTSTGVLMSSGASSPAAGDWGGLYIGYYDDGSVIEGLDLEYGGANGQGGLFLYYSDVSVSDSSFTDNENHGVSVYWGTLEMTGTTVQDNEDDGVSLHYSALETSGGPTFTNNTITGNGGYPMSVDADYLGQLDSSSSFSGNGDEYILVGSDYVTDDATWQLLDVPFQVAGDIYVQGTGRPEVEVDDGTEFYFENNAGLSVGSGAYGSLIVDGSSTGVLFSSTESSPSGGDWDGVYIGYYDQGSELTGLEIEYGGDNGYGCLYAYYVDLVVTDSSFHDCDGAGGYAYAGEWEVTGSSFEDNETDGLYLDSAGLGSTFSNNTMTGNGDFPLSVLGDYLGEIDSTNSFSGNGEDYIEVISDYITSDATWSAHDVPYYVAGTLYIQGSGRPEIEIEDGAELYFTSGSALYVGWGGAGLLTIDGSSTGVLMSSAKSSPAAGDWGGLLVGYYTTDTAELTGLTVEYGGDNGNAGLYLYYSDAELSDCDISDNDNAGIYILGGELGMTDSTVSGNDSVGVSLATNAELSGSLTGNTITGNGDYPMQVPANHLGNLDSSSSFSGNGDDLIYVLADTVDDDATWQALDVDYLVAGAVYIQGSGRPHVDVDEGVTMQFESNVNFYVGWGTYGSLALNGSSTDLVTFTSAQSTPAAGDWDGLNYGYYCVDSDSNVDYALVEYGGGSGYGNIWWYYCSGSISDSELANSSAYGMYLYGTASPTTSNLTYTSNASGDTN